MTTSRFTRASRRASRDPNPRARNTFGFRERARLYARGVGDYLRELARRNGGVNTMDLEAWSAADEFVISDTWIRNALKLGTSGNPRTTVDFDKLMWLVDHLGGSLAEMEQYMLRAAQVSQRNARQAHAMTLTKTYLWLSDPAAREVEDYIAFVAARDTQERERPATNVDVGDDLLMPARETALGEVRARNEARRREAERDERQQGESGVANE